MQQTDTLETALPHSADVARESARQHGKSELENKAEVVTPTMSQWDTHYISLKSPRNGELSLETLFSVEEWTGHYAETFSRNQLTDIHDITEFSGRWFNLAEQATGVRSRATGELTHIHSVVVIPSWTDGALGELIWVKPEWAGASLTVEQQVQLSCALGAYEVAWRSADFDARLAMVEDTTCSVIRVAEVNGERRRREIAWTKEELRTAWSDPEAGEVLELERLSVHMTSWYVFAAYRARLQLSDRTVERETTCIFPLGASLKYLGELSYSLEIEI
jgi:hypothetical protein